MRLRLISFAILLLALVPSVAGNVLLVAFCPSFGTSHADCSRMVPQSHDSHSGMTHDMHGMDMQDVPIITEKTGIGASQVADLPLTADTRSAGIKQPFETCSHCFTHSKFPQSALAWRQADTVRSSTDVEAPLAITNVSYAGLTPPAVKAREHAPPAQASSLHVRLNVFRI